MTETVRVSIIPADDYGTLEIRTDPGQLHEFDPEVPVETLRRWERITAEYEAMQAELRVEYAGYEAKFEADEQAHPEKYGPK